MTNRSDTRETNNGMVDSSSSPLGDPRRGPELSTDFMTRLERGCCETTMTVRGQ